MKARDVRVEPLQAWAVVVAKRPGAGYDAHITSGNERCDIFWTRRDAVIHQRLLGVGVVVPVVVNQVFGR